KQKWLKENGYKNVGWDNVTQLYQKINELLADPNEDELSLEELFLQADRIGQKYQTREEINHFRQQLATEVNSISEKLDKQFPEEVVEVVDFSQKSRSSSHSRRSRKKYR
ncbi:MAG: hypothetical protein AAFU78_10675, partial [Cyanobacteria bacterium J06633_2]